ncbi:MAG: c-type cytochrome [Bradyrhizobium sp.]
MIKGTRPGMFLIALTLAMAGQVAGADAQPRDDAGSDPGSLGQMTVAQGMMGQGMTGRGTMGPSMMQSLAPPESGATGDSIFRSQCSQCHILKAGSSDRPGPSLHGLFGSKAGRAPAYAYSTPMRESGVVWNDTTLDQYIAAPQSYIPGNTMSFPGIADKTARQRLVAYLKEATR